MRGWINAMELAVGPADLRLKSRQLLQPWRNRSTQVPVVSPLVASCSGT